jgi:hypothetical protein
MIYRVREGERSHIGINYDYGTKMTRFIIKFVIPIWINPWFKMYRDWPTQSLSKGMSIWYVRFRFRMRTFKNPTLFLFNITLLHDYCFSKHLFYDEILEDNGYSRLDIESIVKGELPLPNFVERIA